MYDFHNDQARILKKAMKRSVANLQQDLFDSQDEDDDIKPFIQKNRKRQRRDQDMNQQWPGYKWKKTEVDQRLLEAWLIEKGIKLRI